MTTEIRSQKSGFTLVEVVVSILILTIVAMGAGGAFVYTRRSMETGNQKIIAAHLIEAKIISCVDKGAKALAAATTTYATPELRNGLIERTITAPDGTDNWKKVLIKVGWDDISAPAVVHTSISQCAYSRQAVVFLSQG